MIRLVALLAIALAQVVAIPPEREPLQQNRAPVRANPAPDPNAAPSARVDRLFAQVAAESSHAEITFAKLALTRSHASEVRAYARRMIAEHTGLERALAPSIARVLGKPPSPSLAPADALTYDRLQHLADVDFDQAYVLSQVAGHLDAQGAFETEAHDGADPTLVAMARTWLPTIRSHVELAIQVTKDVGGNSPLKTGAQ